MFRLIICISIVLSCASSVAEYIVVKDDFSNGLIHKFYKDSTDNKSVIMISCLASKKIQVQLITSIVIFPDDSNDSGRTSSCNIRL